MFEVKKGNYRTDTRKPRRRDGICSIARCSNHSGVSFYGWALCDPHWNYYCEVDYDSAHLKRILNIKDKKPAPKEEDWDPFEEEAFDPFEENEDE